MFTSILILVNPLESGRGHLVQKVSGWRKLLISINRYQHLGSCLWLKTFWCIFHEKKFLYSIAQPWILLQIVCCSLVIMNLVDLAHGKQRHVPYRDSRLTFLLQVIILTRHITLHYIWVPLMHGLFCFWHVGFTWRKLKNYDNCKCQPFSMVMNSLTMSCLTWQMFVNLLSIVISPFWMFIQFC